jgi:uncharacterized membrane protein (Fun14 family)
MTENKDIDPVDPVNQVIEGLTPILAKLGFGGIMGYCSGLALKKIGKAVAFMIGVGFIFLQTLAYKGYITIDWDQIKLSLHKTVDATGDGKVDAEDLKAYWQKVKKILTQNVPNAGGFSIGFLYGVQSG